MKKLVGAVLLLAILWALPGARARISAAALPALDRLGPAGEVIGEPMRRAVARSRAARILRVMASDYANGQALPQEQAFRQWLETRLPDVDPADPWGNAYWYQRTRDMLTVGSNGPDGRRGTDDDITHGLPY
ncbi:MAG TPA: type II secretion system protein GspG [Longimicrobiales bacterium]|nr:type II secretion system protein GspG [Longimicrobiales bacterium]